MLELEGGSQTKRKGKVLDASVIAMKLTDRCPGMNFDWGGRHNIALPRQREFQGVFYYAKHICGMDRGHVPEFPEWYCHNQLVSVPLDAALREDFPILSMDSQGNPNIDEHTNAFAVRKTPQRVLKIGWRELFLRLVNARLPGITPAWLGKTFGVPMDWLKSGEEKPMKLPEPVRGVA